jgi:glycosyltransferase involved in cell wall biosynthesis
MEKEPLISVVIPVYNGEQYVASCLDNMASQTYKNLEIIVVDDGSTDKSAEIARKYRANLIRHEKNCGLSAARNTGIDAAKGEYIHFMDVDDGINNEYYFEMVKAITETGADIACGGMMNEKRYYKTQRFKKKKVYISAKAKMKATYVGKWGYVWRYLFRADFLKRYNLRFEEGRLIEDLKFSLLAVYHANKLVVVPNAEYIYYYRENSIINNKNEAHRKKKREDKLHAVKFQHDFSKRNNIRIPGVNTGRAVYMMRKIFLSLSKRQNPF